MSALRFSPPRPFEAPSPPQPRQRRGGVVVSDTLRAFANGRKDDWDGHLPLAVFAINKATSTLGGDLTPLFRVIDRGAHPRLPLSPPHDDFSTDESPVHYALRMRAMETAVR
jgi:hypothetical protein